MKKMIILIFLLLVVVVVVVGCNQRHTDVEDSIDAVVKDQNANEIHVTSHTHFDWDKAFLFTPYSTTESMEDQLGTTFKDKSNIDMRDDMYLLVFLHADEVVHYAEIKRHGSDFSIKESEYLTPSEDMIHIERH